MEAYQGRVEASKGKCKLIEEDDESFTQNELNDIDEHLLSRKFSKLKYNINSSTPRPFRNSSQPKSLNFVDRPKVNCYNYGLASHFSNECRKPKSKTKNTSSHSVDYQKKYFKLLK